MLTSTAADAPAVLTRLQASVCLSPQKPSRNRFSTCLFKNKQTNKNSLLFLLSLLLLKPDPFFYHLLEALTHPSAAWPPLHWGYLFLPPNISFPSEFLPLHRDPSAQTSPHTPAKTPCLHGLRSRWSAAYTCLRKTWASALLFLLQYRTWKSDLGHDEVRSSKRSSWSPKFSRIWHSWLKAWPPSSPTAPRATI